MEMNHRQQLWLHSAMRLPTAHFRMERGIFAWTHMNQSPRLTKSCKDSCSAAPFQRQEAEVRLIQVIYYALSYGLTPEMGRSRAATGGVVRHLG